MARIIALNGFMGCGKTMVAAIMAKEMGWFHFDLDNTIEIEEKRSIPEIFKTDGEKGFRELEQKYLQRIVSDYEEFPDTFLLSLGGGTLLNPQCVTLLRSCGFIIYLRAGTEELTDNLCITGIERRPLLQDCQNPSTGRVDRDLLKAKVTSMLAERSDAYETAADLILDIDKKAPAQIAKHITELLRLRGRNLNCVKQG